MKHGSASIRKCIQYLKLSKRRVRYQFHITYPDGENIAVSKIPLVCINTCIIYIQTLIYEYYELYPVHWETFRTEREKRYI